MVLIRLVVLHLQIFNLNKKWHMAGIDFEFDNDIHLQNMLIHHIILLQYTSLIM